MAVGRRGHSISATARTAATAGGMLLIVLGALGARSISDAWEAVGAARHALTGAGGAPAWFNGSLMSSGIFGPSSIAIAVICGGGLLLTAMYGAWIAAGAWRR